MPHALARLLSMVARPLDYALECGGTSRWNAVVLHAEMRWYCTLECCGIARWNAVVLHAGLLWYLHAEMLNGTACSALHSDPDVGRAESRKPLRKARSLVNTLGL